MPPRRPAFHGLVPLLAALAGLPSPAGAHAPNVPPPPTPPPQRDRSLVLMVPDLVDDDLDERLLHTIEALRDPGSRVDVVRYDARSFPKADIVPASRRRAGEFMARGVLWIDIGADDRLAIYLYEVDTDRFLGRRITTSVDERAVAIETLANIAASIVAESAVGPVEGLAEVDPESLEDPEPQTRAPPRVVTPEDPQTPPPAPVQWPRLWLGLGYAGSTFSREVVLQHGLSLAAAWGPARGAFVGVRYDLVLPSRVDERGVVFELRRHPVSIEGGYRLPFGRRRRGDFEISARVVVDPIRRLSDASASSEPVTGDTLRVFSSAALGLGVGFSPIRQVRLGLRAGPEVLMSRARYVVGGPTGDVALDPQPVRAFFEAGAQFGLLWRGRANRSRPEEF